MKWTYIIIIQFFCSQLFAQISTNITVNVDSNEGIIEPLWGDYYEMHLLFGWGGNPIFSGNHQQYIDDVSFAPEMSKLKPRYIRVSSGRFENPPDTSYFSENSAVLKNLWTEFYHGGNSLQSAQDLTNYDFTYMDSLVRVVQSTGASPFMEMAYMPFALSSDTIANYIGTVPFTHLYSWDNSIRNSPPADVEVYALVIYHLIRHLNFNFGVEYFELWNEPDQFPLNTFFWKGNAQQLYDMYEAVVRKIEEDSELRSNVKIGCCGFALNSSLQLFPINFLTNVQVNKTRMDFISFHPYSATELGGYDNTKVELVKQWRDKYAPEAELINSEWGILSSSFGSKGWNDLDYGLEKTKAIIDMNYHGIRMAHQATLADINVTSSTCCLGLFYVDPEFSPKQSAFVNTNLNKLKSTTNRLDLEITNGNYAIAGKNLSGDTIVVVFPATDPLNDKHNVSITVDNLPWTEGSATRYELTESSYANNVLLNATSTSTISNSSFNESFDFLSDQNSGRLILWELINGNTVNVNSINKKKNLVIYPNPANGILNIKIENLVSDFDLKITDVLGRQIYSQSFLATSNFEQQISLNNNGIFYISLVTKDQIITKKIENWH